MGASCNAGGYGTRVELPPVFRGGISLSKHGTRERRNSLRRNLIIATRYKGAREAPRRANNETETRGEAIKAEGERLGRTLGKELKVCARQALLGRREAWRRE